MHGSITGAWLPNEVDLPAACAEANFMQGLHRYSAAELDILKARIMSTAAAAGGNLPLYDWFGVLVSFCCFLKQIFECF